MTFRKETDCRNGVAGRCDAYGRRGAGRRLMAVGMAACLLMATPAAAAPGSGVQAVGQTVIAGGSQSSSVSPAMYTVSQLKYPVAVVASRTAGYYFNGMGMYTYNEFLSDVTALRTRYGAVVNVIGTTVDGRSIYDFVIGDANASHRLLVTGGMHAREYITSMGNMRQIRDLLELVKNNDPVMEDVCIHFVPMLNPDGISISQFGMNGLLSQEMRSGLNSIIRSWADWGITTDQDKYNWYLNKWKNNANGVDLNRNFPTSGWSGLNDQRQKPDSDLYKGSSAGSENETKALMNLVKTVGFDAAVNYHSQGQVVYWHLSAASDAINEKASAMADAICADTGYRKATPGKADTDSGDSASFMEWLETSVGIPSVTVEVGLGTAPVQAGQISDIEQQNKNVLPDVLKLLKAQ